VVALILLAAFADAPISPSSTSYPLEECTFRVSAIYIEGADDMRASAILRELPFKEGDRIPYRRLREAERRLERLGLFVVDPATGVRPHVAPLQDGDASDVQITVVRKPEPGAR